MAHISGCGWRILMTHHKFHPQLHSWFWVTLMPASKTDNLILHLIRLKCKIVSYTPEVCFVFLPSRPGPHPAPLASLLLSLKCLCLERLVATQHAMASGTNMSFEWAVWSQNSNFRLFAGIKVIFDIHKQDVFPEGKRKRFSLYLTRFPDAHQSWILISHKQAQQSRD